MAKPFPTEIPDDVKARFWAKVDVRGPDECWPWTGPSNRGYGTLYHEGRRYRATWLAWSLANGEPFPSGSLACHSCDNPPCVNPSHLWAGSSRDNMRDMIAKGRSRSESSKNAVKTHCVRGHPLAGDNLHIKHHARHVERVCRTCQREHVRKWRARVRQSGARQQGGVQ